MRGRRARARAAGAGVTLTSWRRRRRRGRGGEGRGSSQARGPRRRRCPRRWTTKRYGQRASGAKAVPTALPTCAPGKREGSRPGPKSRVGGAQVCSTLVSVSSWSRPGPGLGLEEGKRLGGGRNVEARGKECGGREKKGKEC